MEKSTIIFFYLLFIIKNLICLMQKAVMYNLNNRNLNSHKLFIMIDGVFLIYFSKAPVFS